MMGDRISCKRHRDTSYDQKHAVSGQECDGRLLYPLGTAPLEKTSTFCNLYVISPAFALLRSVQARSQQALTDGFA